MKDKKLDTWQELERAFNVGGTHELAADIKYSSLQPLRVNTGRVVTLDLKGHTIHSGNSSGYVIGVWGTLTVKDTSQGQPGQITGGKSGGVYVADGGTFNLEGGSVTGNTASQGGGVCVNGGTFTMTGGSVSGNTASEGGGVYLSSSSTFNLSGAPVISGNVRGGTIENGVLAGGTPDNVLCYYIAPQVTGELTTGASIGVNRRESGGVGLVVRGDESYTLTAADLTHFTSDDDAYFIRLDGNNGGELFLPTAVLKSYSLTLEGEICLNFKVQIPPELVNSVHAVIVYNRTETDTPMEATINEYIYKVTKRVPAKEIGNDVGLKIVANGSGKAIQLVDSGNDEYPDNTASFSVTDYCNAVDQVDSIEGVSTEKLQKLKSLVRALQNYGAYAQQYFKKGNAPGFAQNAGDIDSVTVSGYSMVKNGQLEGISLTSVSLTLESETAINLRFTVAEGHSFDEYTFACSGGRTLTRKTSGNTLLVKINNIPAKELNTPYTVTVT